MIGLSFIAVLSLGLSVAVSNVQASENAVPLITQAADQIFVSRIVPYTTRQSMWVTETRNGKTYSGYLYNRGFADGDGRTVLFTGNLKAGPYVDPFILKNN